MQHILKTGFLSLIMALLAFSGAAVALAESEVRTATSTLEENISQIVYIACGNWVDEYYGEYLVSGSGVILGDGVVLTNAHVVVYDGGDGWLYEYDFCDAGIAQNTYSTPSLDIPLYYEDNAWNWTDELDYHVLSAYDDLGNPYPFGAAATYGNADSLVHGDEMTLLGYPVDFGATITSTFGAVSGFEGTSWIKTDAITDPGGSGGGAFDVNGNLIGLTTLVGIGEFNSVTYVQNLNAILEDIFGSADVIRDYSTLYTTENVVCIFNECFQFGEGAEVDEVAESADDVTADPDESTKQEEEEVTEDSPGAYDETKHDDALQDRMEGYILLQVEENGEAWYVNTEDGLRYYMRDGDVAYEMMRAFGLGITDADLEHIPAVDSAAEMLDTDSVCSTNTLASRLAGQILIQVQQHGEAWYIHPDTCKRIYLEDGDAAYSIMRFLSLGIANLDLEKLPTGTLTGLVLGAKTW